MPTLRGLLCLTLALAPAALAQTEEPLELLSHKDLQVAIQRLANRHSEHVTVLPVGSSREGRKIDALRLAAGERTAGRPAILVVANLEGPRAYTSAIALEQARELAEGYGEDEAITRLLDSTTVYFVPRANPDATEARFARPLAETEASGHGIDNDRDGRSGEDGPSDVNGDGLITWMRVPDPAGTWIEDPNDPRALVEADAALGERGRWKLVREGLDSDRDESVCEDPEHDAIVNRNFPADWEEHVARAGLYSTDEPEARALIEFVLTHQDIAAVVVYGAQDNLVEVPKGIPDDAPASKRVPKKGVYESDVATLKKLSESYARITESKAKGSNDDAGSFQLWCYAHRGLVTLNAVLWEVPLDELPEEEEGEGEKPARKPSDDAKRLAWIDLQEDDVPRFVDWQPFEHESLGPVEIGGFAPYARIEPPAAELRGLADRTGEFLIELGASLPRVAIASCTATDLGGGLLRIEAAVVNDSILPFRTRSAERNRRVRPARVSLTLPTSATLLSGSRRDLLGELDGLGGRAEYTWLVSGVRVNSITVTVDTDHASSATANPELAR